MRLHVLADGRLRGPLAPAAADYAQRLTHYCDLDLREVAGPARLAAAVTALDVRVRVVALDAGGRQRTSEELAAWLDPLRAGPLAIVVGGADGLPAAVTARADEAWSLGAGTLAHQLALVVCLEQLYRAFTILAGHPYHRG